MATSEIVDGLMVENKEISNDRLGRQVGTLGPARLKWDDNEVRVLVRQVIAGAAPSEIVVPGRSAKAVFHKMCELRQQGALNATFIKQWTCEEINSLLVQIAIELRRGSELIIPGRTASAVYSRIKKLRKEGFVITVGAEPWTEEESQSIIRQIEQEGTMPGQVRVDGRTKIAIFDQIHDLRRQGLITRRFRKSLNPHKWTSAQLKKLRDLATLEGFKGATRIYKEGDFPDRTVRSIRAALFRAGVKDLAQSERLKNAHHWTKAEKEVLQNFLQNEGRYWPSALVARKFNCNQDYIGRRRKDWSLQFKHEEAMLDPVYKSWHEQQVQERSKCTVRKNQEKRDSCRSEMRSLAQCFSLNGAAVGKQKCAVCDSIWYATVNFFYVKSPADNVKGVRAVLSTTCLACPKPKNIRRSVGSK